MTSTPKWIEEALNHQDLPSDTRYKCSVILQGLERSTRALCGLWEVPMVNANVMYMQLWWGQEDVDTCELAVHYRMHSRETFVEFNVFEQPPESSPLYPLAHHVSMRSDDFSTAPVEGLVMRWILLTRNVQPNSMAAYSVAREAIHSIPDGDPTLDTLLHTLQTRNATPIPRMYRPVLSTTPDIADRIAYMLQGTPVIFIPYHTGGEPEDFAIGFISLVASGEVTCHDDGECTFHRGCKSAPEDTTNWMDAVHGVICGYHSLTFDQLQSELEWPRDRLEAHLGRLLRWGWIRYEKIEVDPYHLIHLDIPV